MQATPDRPARRRLHPLVLAACLALGGVSAAQAQSLAELFEAARNYDATYLAARSQYDANLAQSAQARAGLLPEVGLGAGANWSRRDSSNNLLTAPATTRTSRSRPASRSIARPTSSPTIRRN